jgi:hypothetical protein
VAYTSDESGRYEVYIQAFPNPGGKWLISAGGGSSPEWAPTGQELFYVAPGNKLMVVTLKMGADSVQPSAPHELFAMPGGSAYRVAADGKRFLISTPLESGAKPLQVIINWPPLLMKRVPAE